MHEGKIVVEIGRESVQVSGYEEDLLVACMSVKNLAWRSAEGEDGAWRVVAAPLADIVQAEDVYHKLAKTRLPRDVRNDLCDPAQAEKTHRFVISV